MKKFDAIIIGFGKGGKTLAPALVKQGMNVAIIERSSSMYGGTCINIACIPTKSLAEQAKKSVDYTEAISKKDDLTAFLRKKNFNNLDQNDGITVLTGEASFVSPYKVKVEMEHETVTLSAEHIFINTGAESIIPDIPGVKESKHVYTSTTLMEIDVLPERLVIVGGGYIGLEFASMYANFGSDVVVLDRGETFIPREDRDIAEEVQQTLEKKGIQIKLNVKVKSVEESIITYEDGNGEHKIEADAVLLATGRKPSTERLNLEAAGVNITDRGAVQVDEILRTNVPHIWAIGDVKGGPQFTYISLDDYRIINDQLFGAKKRTTKDRQFIPYSVFIDPPLSRIGLSEQEAIDQGYDVKIAKLPAAAIPRARILEQTEGLLKAVVDAKTNHILGCTLFCAQSSEIINNIQLAMQTGQDYTFLKDNIFTHPSMSEALNDLFEQVPK